MSIPDLAPISRSLTFLLLSRDYSTISMLPPSKRSVLNLLAFDFFLLMSVVFFFFIFPEDLDFKDDFDAD